MAAFTLGITFSAISVIDFFASLGSTKSWQFAYHRGFRSVRLKLTRHVMHYGDNSFTQSVSSL